MTKCLKKIIFRKYILADIILRIPSFSKGRGNRFYLHPGVILINHFPAFLKKLQGRSGGGGDRKIGG